MASHRVTVELYLTNRKAVEALAFAARVCVDAAESQPWNKDLPKAAKALRYALKKLGVKAKPT